MLQKYLYNLGFHQKELVELLCAEGEVVVLKKGDNLIEEGKLVRYIPIVLDGEIRVWTNYEDGKQILLYYIMQGQTCALTLKSVLQKKLSIVEANATKDSTLLMLPVNVLQPWMVYKEWNHFILNSILNTMGDVVDLYSDLAFYKLEQRITCFLNGVSNREGVRVINVSHSFIAKEMGTSREVVSKVLKKMELMKKVRLGIGSIELLD